MNLAGRLPWGRKDLASRLGSGVSDISDDSVAGAAQAA